MTNRPYIDEAGLSIIIPVYNADKYLHECIDSIINENIINLQIILVDDGSTDDSLNICKSYCEKYHYVSVIHKDNEGPGVARNIGITAAEKKYLMFVDADDLLKKDSGITINNSLHQQFDVCFLGAEFFFPDGKTINLGDNIKLSGLQEQDEISVIKYLSSLPKFPGSPCTKIFNTRFLKNNKIVFPNDNFCAEDLLFVIKALKFARSFYAIDDLVYWYRQNVPGSRSSNLNQNHKRIIAFIDEAVSFLTIKRNPIDIKSRYLLSFVVYEYFVLILYYSKMKKRTQDSKELKKYLNNSKWLLKYSSGFLQRIAGTFLYVFGIDLTADIIGKIKG